MHDGVGSCTNSASLFFDRCKASFGLHCIRVRHHFQRLVYGLCSTSVLLFRYYAISFEHIQIFLASRFCFSVVVFSRISREAAVLQNLSHRRLVPGLLHL